MARRINDNGVQEVYTPPRVACWNFDKCKKNAMVKIHTPDGWRNYCFECGDRAPRQPVITRNPHCEAVREAYRKSSKYRGETLA